ncbi:uncharacterized protein DUF397 [Streptomyces sp. KhCrAH-43]|uniref:DUF397 domain-containing protein n=1 Tax=unclassified Streptomyces TaxID=2593676 RepID=UPI000375E6C9|nr:MULTISPECIES: DUF397 domain-containing protein [unclassified Streptomyces]MYS36365.1 DUF397 domain-containing protein [Streptomyces sp. SID4920]MYX63928.1 DUF397 domain-containing protein [Streptomyces sp. SID8373]RAJ45721.1 uncharacterized protein DUF397 [Streptomyces sp. KhCrAH-43]
MTDRQPTAEAMAAAEYRKSSYSGANGNECVEVARLGRQWACVRDSKVTGGPVLATPAAAFGHLLDALKGDRL